MTRQAAGRILGSALFFIFLSARAEPASFDPPLSAAAQLGKRMFFDKRLSASGQQACASCHDPEHAYAPANHLAVQPGGRDLRASGTRAVPSLRYQEATPPYADELDNPDGISAPGPGGGYTQDGRAPTLAEQARIPLLAPNEMANRSGAEVVGKIKAGPYAAEFREAFGERVFDDPKRAFRKALEALQAFQLEDRSFHPYDSKYDLYAGNKIGGTFTPAEARGFKVYSDPERGNCFACHYNGAGLNGSVRLFTDFTFSAIGAPRNMEIPANKDPRYFDLGICGRPDHPLPASAQYCGMFKTPTLRNVATRKVFFHNGSLKSLKDVIRFYNTRDTNPELWYPVVAGEPRKFNDLPARYRDNIDMQKPLDGRARGSTPAMSEQDMADLEAFLNTLTDGYHVAPDLQGRELQAALEDYLDQRGELCLGKPKWPIEVTERDARVRTRDAVQLPALEKAGVVVSSAVGGAPGSRRYALTEKGGRSYSAPRSDFCAGRLRLDRIVSAETRKAADGGLEATVSYTYSMAADGWTQVAEARKAFPMVVRVLDGERSLQLQQRFRRIDNRWLAADAL